MSDSKPFVLNVNPMPDRVILRYDPPVELKSEGGLVMPNSGAVEDFGGGFDIRRRDQLAADVKNFRPEAAQLYKCGDGITERTQSLKREIETRATNGERFLVKARNGGELFTREIRHYGAEMDDLNNLRIFHIEEVAVTFTLKCGDCGVALYDPTERANHACP